MKLVRYKIKAYKKLLKKKFITGLSKDKVMENLLNMSDSDEEGRDKAGNNLDKEQLRKIENNEVKGTKQDKKRKRLENKGHKVADDSDDNSEDIDESGDEDTLLEKAKKKQKKQDEEDAEHKPIKKSDEEVKKGMFLGEKYGHFKIGTYV